MLSKKIGKESIDGTRASWKRPIEEKVSGDMVDKRGENVRKSNFENVEMLNVENVWKSFRKMAKIMKDVKQFI